jgi:hypothetical protein
MEDVAVASLVVPMIGFEFPTQGHIALTTNNDEMMMVYVTGKPTTPSVRWVS